MTGVLMGEDFTDEELDLLVTNIDQFTPEEQAEIMAAADTLAARRHAATCQLDLIEFCKHTQPDYKVGKHHRILADLLMEIAEGKKDGFASISPRGTVNPSLFRSIFLHGS